MATARKKFEGVKARTPTFRASFLNVFKPKAFEEGADEKYSVQMLFDKEKTDLTDLKKKMKGVAEKAWGKDPKKWPTNFSWPFNDGDNMPEDMDDDQKEIYAGMTYCNADSKQPPGIYGANPKDSSDDPGPQDLFSGCYCQASLFMVPYENIGGRGNKGRSGIKLYLQGIQLIERGERLGSGASRDDFDVVENENGDSSDDDSEDPGF